jgi:uncharacterized protein YtpQ (UPF0354 family)
LDQPATVSGASRPLRRLYPAAPRIIVVALFAIIVALLVEAKAAAPLSPQAFTQNVVAALKAVRPGVTIHIIRPLQLEIIDEKGRIVTGNLDNAFLDYRLDPTDIDRIVGEYVATYPEAALLSRPTDRARVVPVVKSRRWIADYASFVKEEGYGDDAVAAYDPLNSELVVVYAENRGKNYRFLVPQDLRLLGIDRDELPLLARENLARLAPPPELVTGPYVYGIRIDGNCEASLILYPSWWESRPIKVDGDYVVAVPARDILLVTGSNNPAGIAQLRDLARQTVQQGSHTIVDTLFVFRNGGFERFE